MVLALALQPGSVTRDALSAPCRCVGRNRWKALRERPPHQMWPEAACSSALDARYRTLAVPRTAVATRPLVLRLTQCLHGAFSVLCDEVVQNRQKAPHQRPPHQMRPEAASSSAPDSHRRALFTPRNAVATRMLALRLTQRLCDALSAPCRYVGRNRWKALRERPPHQMRPEAACSSALDARYRTLAVLRTAIAARVLALRLTQCLRDGHRIRARCVGSRDASSSCGPGSAARIARGAARHRGRSGLREQAAAGGGA